MGLETRVSGNDNEDREDQVVNILQHRTQFKRRWFHRINSIPQFDDNSSRLRTQIEEEISSNIDNCVQQMLRIGRNDQLRRKYLNLLLWKLSKGKRFVINLIQVVEALEPPPPPTPPSSIPQFQPLSAEKF